MVLRWTTFCLNIQLSASLKRYDILCVCVCVCVQQVVVDAVLAIRKEPKKPIDLHMVEIMEMMHKTDTDTRSVGIYR